VPVAGETVQLISPSRKRRYSAVTDGRGRFSASGVEVASDYQVSVRPRGPYRDYRETGVAVSADGVRLAIVLEPLSHGTLSGRMVDLDGHPVARFGLWLRSESARSQPLRVVSDAEGYYTVHQVPDGEIVLETRSFPIFSVSGVDLPLGGRRVLNVTLDHGVHALHGRVLDRYGDPVPASEIVLSWIHDDGDVRSRSMRKAVAEVDGGFAFTRLGPGRHTLSVRAPGFRIARADYMVGAQEEEIEVVLEEAP
jgi:hypothetical protein